VEKRYTSQEELSTFKKILLSEPSNLDAANHYWNALGSVGGHDVRSGGFVIEAYRSCALASHEGVIALARAYRELYENSGEAPRRELFDEELMLALEARLSALRDDERDNVEWILGSVFSRVCPSHQLNRLDSQRKTKTSGKYRQEPSTYLRMVENPDAGDLP